MNIDVPADDNGADEVPVDNAAFFFDRYPPETARWLAEICDEATAKAGDSSIEFRRVLCDLINMGLRDGVPDAFRAAGQIIVANAPGVKYIEQNYLKLDQSRAAVIETGPRSSGPTGEAESGSDAPDQKVPGKDGQEGGGGKTRSGPGCGTGATAGTGTAVTVIGGAGGRTKENDKDIGIGHQGTLFIVQWSDYRASVPARIKKAQTEHRRLYGIKSDAGRQMRVQADELDFLNRLVKADALLEDLINTHRAETSIAGVLRAAGRTPEELGLTEKTVLWLDRQLKAA
ncbi:hypothetical protein ABT275_38545 [Streptomyces sp. NPDC001185]|uniref:hypothetical protein n=1 Tax=Streptomyces sp. NPDC001185 TaxID=3154380 RepID=UPI00332FF3F3